MFGHESQFIDCGFLVLSRLLAMTLFFTFLRDATLWEVGGLRGVRPTALKTVRSLRQLPRMAPSMQASSFLISSQLSVWRLVSGRSGVGVVFAFGEGWKLFSLSGCVLAGRGDRNFSVAPPELE